MFITPVYKFGDVISNIKKLISDAEEEVLNTLNIKSYEDYRFSTGQILGMKKALEVIRNTNKGLDND